MTTTNQYAWLTSLLDSMEVEEYGTIPQKEVEQAIIAKIEAEKIDSYKAGFIAGSIDAMTGGK